MDPHPLANLFKRPNYDEPIASELSALDYLYEVLFEIHESEKFDEVLKEEIYKVIHDTSLTEEHDRNVPSMNSLNIHDANDMQSHKLGDAMFDIFSPPSFDEQIYYDDRMPTIYDDGDDTYAIMSNDNHETDHNGFNLQCGYVNQVSHDSYFVEFAPTTMDDKEFAYVESNKCSMLVDHQKNALCDSYIVQFIHDASENYYEGGTYGCRNCNNIKFPPYVLKVLK